jgi:hypothetical protein
MTSALADSQGRMHPNRVLAALQDALGPNAIVITDGGDFLSFWAHRLNSASHARPGAIRLYWDRGTVWHRGELGFPDRPVVVATAIRTCACQSPGSIGRDRTSEAVSSDAKTGLAWVPDMQPLAAWDEAERKWRNGG